jgi:hypothetical protein
LRLGHPTPHEFQDLLNANLFFRFGITLTTVGYGDVYPITAGGRLLSLLVGVTGYLIGIAFFVAIVSGSLTLIKKFASF